jgi:hypothetical protein
VYHAFSIRVCNPPSSGAESGSGPSPISFGARAALDGVGRAGCDDERSIRACERLAERFDGKTIRVGGALKVSRKRHVVLEREVNHAVRCRRGAAQNVEVV